MHDLTGQDIGRYHILEPLGEGGMAKVYKAYDTHLENEVAVKVIRTDQLAPALLERTNKRFEREAKEVAKLSHPNIVRVIDYGEHEGTPYLVMQYLHGGTMKQLMGKPIPYQKAAALLVPIARALEYAHQHKMVHRDVKPSNILITDSGEPMLTDFGIVKMLDVQDGATLTGTGVGLGTPEYMAPEQWVGEFSPAVDQYSLGVVLFELITGRRPYNADTPAAVLLKQAADPLPRPGNFVSGLPDEVEHVILKALAKNPVDRYVNMGELANALVRLERGVGREPEPTLIAGVPAVPTALKPEPAAAVAEEGATIIEVMPPAMQLPPKKPAEVKPIKAAKQPKPPAQRKKLWLILLGGGGLLVVLAVILGITQGWFSPAAQPTTAAVAVPTMEPIVQSPTQAAPTAKPTSEAPAAAATTAVPAGPRMKVCMVTDAGGIDDKSFNANTWSGIQAAQAKLNIEGRVVQSNDVGDFEKNINIFIDGGCGLIVGTGWQISEAMNAAAARNPKVLFTGVDFEFNPSLPNTVGQLYQSDEAAFLAGYLAAGMSQTNKVGVYGGLNIGTVTVFMDGFARGVEYYNQQHNTKVYVIGWNTSTQTGLMAETFTDTAIGKQIAEQLIEQGADVILPVAGNVGFGSLDAIWPHSGKVWFIGVDSDWAQNQPQYAPYILTSVLKRMDVTTYAVIEGIWSGNFTNSTYIGTLANSGVGIAAPNPAVPNDLLIELEQVKADIIAGKIKLSPTYKLK